MTETLDRAGESAPEPAAHHQPTLLVRLADWSYRRRRRVLVFWILLFFGTSGDLEFLKNLIGKSGFRSEVVAQRGLRKEGLDVQYFTFRLTRGSATGARAPVG